jgi:hypothetical protein
MVCSMADFVFMNKTYTITHLAVMGLIVFLVTLQLSTWMGCNHDSSYKSKLELKDSLEAIDKRQIIDLKQQLVFKDTAIAQKERQTASILQNIDKHQTVYKPIYEDLKNIPARIDVIRNDDAAIKDAFSKREQD